MGNQTNTNQADASGQAVGIQGLAARDAGVVVSGSGNKYAGLNLELANSKGASVVLGATGSEVQTLTNSFLEGVKNLVSQNASAQNAALASVSQLSKSSQTGGEDDRNKIMLWLTLAGLGLAALSFFRR